MRWILGVLAFLVLAVVGDLVSEEIRGWLDLIPRGILRLAAMQLDKAQRETIYEEEWLPELEFALKGDESRPIMRLIIGIWFAAGLVIAARRVARRVNRTPQTLASAPVAEARATALPADVITMTGGTAAATMSATATLTAGGAVTTEEAAKIARRTVEQMASETRGRIGTRTIEPPRAPREGDGTA